MNKGSPESAERETEGRYHGVGPRGYQRSDDRILEDLHDTLRDHPDLDATDMEISCSSGEVTLSGKVRSQRCRDTAEEIARSRSGVRNVRNEISVEEERESAEQNYSRLDAIAQWGMDHNIGDTADYGL